MKAALYVAIAIPASFILYRFIRSRLPHDSTGSNEDEINSFDEKVFTVKDWNKDWAPYGTDSRRYSIDDGEGLARMLASEAGAQEYTQDERVAILWCAINKANRLKKSLASFLLPPHNASGYWCSTIQDATDDDIVLVDAVISGVFPDPTNGAWSFFEPAKQDEWAVNGEHGIIKGHDAAWFRNRRWTEDNMRVVATIGRWEFFGK